MFSPTTCSALATQYHSGSSDCVKVITETEHVQSEEVVFVILFHSSSVAVSYISGEDADLSITEPFVLVLQQN